MEKEKEEMTEKEKAFPTNEHDVQIAQIKADLKKYEFSMNSELIKLRENGRQKSERLHKSISSIERVVLGSLVLAGYIYSAGKRVDLMEYMADKE